MTTLTLILVTAVVVAAIVLAQDAMVRRSRRRDREIVRRITRYLDALPPARPW